MLLRNQYTQLQLKELRDLRLNIVTLWFFCNDVKFGSRVAWMHGAHGVCSQWFSVINQVKETFGKKQIKKKYKTFAVLLAVQFFPGWDFS